MTTEANAAEAATDTALPNAEAESHESESNPIEDRARRMGWVDEGTYRGPKHKWVPAEEYVRKAEEELPVMRAQLRRYDEDNARYEKANKDLKDQLSEIQKDFKAFGEHSRKAEERAYERARADLEAMKRRSVGEADEEAYEAADRRLRELEEERKARQPEPRKEEPKLAQPGDDSQQNLSPEIKAFVNENKWFSQSMMLQGAMIEFNGDVMREMPHLSEADRLAEAKSRLIAAFPDRFPNEAPPAPKANPRRSEPAAVGSPNGSARAATKKEKTFDSLPPEAKAQFERFASRIPGYTKEEYVKSYQWDS